MLTTQQNPLKNPRDKLRLRDTGAGQGTEIRGCRDQKVQLDSFAHGEMRLPACEVPVSDHM